jgi:hypothetical protein
MKVRIYDRSNSMLITEVPLLIGGLNFDADRDWAEREAWQVAIEDGYVEKTRKMSDFQFELLPD